jgi:DNA-binding transcriptional ArsR family regulator
MCDESGGDHMAAVSGDDLLRIFAALANPHRLRVLAALTGKRTYVSQLARDLGIGRPLLHLHLRRLEEAGLVHGSLELSEDGKAMRFYEVAPFRVELTPALIAAAAASLSRESGSDNATEVSDEERN